MGFRGQCDLCQALVGEAVAHDKAGVTGGATEVDQTTFGQHDDRSSGLEAPAVDLGFDPFPGAVVRFFQISHLDFTIEVSDVANDRFVFHLLHVTAANDVAAAGSRDEDITLCDGLFQGGHFIPLHGRLQRTDGVNLGDQDAGAITAHGVGAALAHIPVAANHNHFTGHHHVRGTLDAVRQGLPASV